jgi:hypothetical protein
MPEEFVTLDYLGTLAGCIAIVTAFTQIVKTYAPAGIPTKWWALIGSVIVIILRQAFLIGDTTPQGIASGFVNLIICLLGATGLYEYAVKPVVAKIAEKKGTE